MEPGSRAGDFTGQPDFFANSGSSPELYLILGAVISDLAAFREVVLDAKVLGEPVAEEFALNGTAIGLETSAFFEFDKLPAFSSEQPVRANDNMKITGIAIMRRGAEKSVLAFRGSSFRSNAGGALTIE